MRDVAHEGQYARPERGPRRDFSRPTPASRDPFFDKPYEPAVAKEQTASWDSGTSQRAPSIPTNIKSKRRVAALFKA
jgi:ATP-dependent RNA helicase RhlE